MVYLLNLSNVFAARLQDLVETVRPTGIESPWADVLNWGHRTTHPTKRKASLTAESEVVVTPKRPNATVEDFIGKIKNIKITVYGYHMWRYSQIYICIYSK